MKYICTINGDNKAEIFTFPRSVDHDCMAEALNRIKNSTSGSWERIHRQPISAGFVMITYDKGAICYGKSITLGIESRDEDSAILNDQVNNT